MARRSLKLLVSIINWNNSAATNTCLAGIAALPPKEQPDVILVDNNSEREPLSINQNIQKNLKSIQTVKNSTNLGFAGGHNPSLIYAINHKYDYVIILNNDTKLVDLALFGKLVSALETSPEAIAAAPTVLQSVNPPIIWYGGGTLNTKLGEAHHEHIGNIYTGEDSAPMPVSFTTGCCLAIDVSKLKQSQLFLPEENFLYWEDTAWCAGAQKQGYPLLYVPSAYILHAVSSSLGTRSPHYIYYNVRGNLLFIFRHTPLMFRPLALTHAFYVSLKYLILIFLRFGDGKLNRLQALWFAWIDGLQKHGGPIERSL